MNTCQLKYPIDDVDLLIRSLFFPKTSWEQTLSNEEF